MEIAEFKRTTDQKKRFPDIKISVEQAEAMEHHRKEMDVVEAKEAEREVVR